MDVHAALIPREYYDHRGIRYTQRDHLRYTKELFEYVRTYLGGDAPVFSEWGSAWLAGSMDGGAFNAGHRGPPTPGQAHARYPFVEQIFHGRMQHWSVGEHGTNYTGQHADPDSRLRRRLALNVLHGRNELLPAYSHHIRQNLTDNTFRLFMYYITAGLTTALGTTEMTSVNFEGNNLLRQQIQYDNGATVRVNQDKDAYHVQGYELPRWGYLAQGNGFLQYRATVTGVDQPVDFVQCPEYTFAYASQPHDFGPVALQGAVAIRRAGSGLQIFEIVKPTGTVQIRPAKLDFECDANTPCRVVRLIDNIERKADHPVSMNRDGSVHIVPAPERDVLRYELGEVAPIGSAPYSRGPTSESWPGGAG